MKTLVVILHYNTAHLTNRLYNQLKPYERDDYELVVLDNGSDSDKRSQYATVHLSRNTLFGGGLNKAFRLILENPLYDSLLFLNSDLVVHGYNLVSALRREMIAGDLTIISPCIIEPSDVQCMWRTMHCWNSRKTRLVPWVDFQAPMIHRRLIDEVGQFHEDLKYGWGQDVLCGIVCREKHWLIGVSDFCPVIHIGSATIKSERNNPVVAGYNYNAELLMIKYFRENGMFQHLVSLRQQAVEYSYSDIVETPPWR